MFLSFGGGGVWWVENYPLIRRLRDTFPLEGEGFRWFCKLYKEYFIPYIFKKHSSRSKSVLFKKQVQRRKSRIIAFPFEGEGVA